MLKLLLDENIGKLVASTLRDEGHDVLSVLEINPGASDNTIIKLAFSEKRILITLDRDFSRLVFVTSRKHRGVIYLRLAKESPSNILKVLMPLIKQYGKKLQGKFVVITEDSIRIR